MENVIIVTTAATYDEELATCLEEAGHEQALDQLRSACCKALDTIKPMRSVCQTSKEMQQWLALGTLSATLQTTLRAVRDSEELLQQILDPLKPENGYEQSLQLANGAYKASRIQFWEMIVAHAETIEAALPGCSASSHV